MVLTGRESLIRLIGKRRRFLPNRHSILSDPIPNPIHHQPEQQQPTTPGDGDNPQNDAVQCPVCSLTLPPDNHRINSHLDSCLSQPKQSGTKRKFTQRTLLQLNFTRPDNLTHADPDSHAPDFTLRKKLQFSESPIADNDSAAVINESSPLLSESNHIDANHYDIIDNIDDKCNIFEVKLETLIVGRRYADQEEVCAGDTVSLSRDSQNVKDPNAIKVVSVDSGGCSKFLGYLPRELAQYLSPLIDNYGIAFQGHVTSVPKHSRDAVPIQIMCHSTPDGESKYEDETFKCLWKNAQHVVESAIKNPSSVKYQLNFCLMIQEALKNNIHLLTEDEKTYMESFASLSNDSQRLFIRMYTRKGPWFRMSSISYPEILNTQKAVKELAEKEYICTVEDGNQLCESDMNDILDVLTVSELREILCFLLKKVGINH
ncbi:Fanconi-associated nuclease 1, variant 3 [Lathyrus oleraceus]|uniref:Fanconi-associated nuclease n=1 Tax=Pisum sativum TaxID=3888 RepID=A0A9D4Y261_PEA|nr:Fanconi-associated nuclease 1, variant 3 [Pisum sativum]